MKSNTVTRDQANESSWAMWDPDFSLVRPLTLPFSAPISPLSPQSSQMDCQPLRQVSDDEALGQLTDKGDSGRSGRRSGGGGLVAFFVALAVSPVSEESSLDLKSRWTVDTQIVGFTTSEASTGEEFEELRRVGRSAQWLAWPPADLKHAVEITVTVFSGNV